ncbi:glycosyl transferase family 41 [Chromohalobacter israelensis]|nr:glycosyl transferase family 41 [Chromohalobacter salexigens]
MITLCLEHLPKGQFELYCYTTSDAVDALTTRIQHCAQKWQPIRHLSDEEFTQKVRDDEIDILIDLSGHNTGSRMRAIAMQPAPLIVKWVGGLINTTGVQAIDYLISDHVETPEGEDEYYTEKLIRLPDDYIVFDPPEKLPALSELPAKRNGYITLACFNNPTKLNDVTLKQWASIMHELPNSRLLLKGRPYTSENFCERLYATLEAEGIPRERLIIEGPGSNYEMLDAYNRADIALDPWPYSGGLTTCESFIMGVPVVTLPGPTFAGRHSATHLVNAGMPELVANSWEEYRARVIELASDLESLDTIRQHLRDVLLQSPVCDGPRFAKHFTDAMRAIWQRYCDDKAPAALTFNKEGEARFEDEDAPVEIHYAEAREDDSTFQWQFDGKLIAVDNGGQLLESDVVRQLLQKKALELISFDPSSRALDTSLKQHEGVHYYPNATLGDGQPGQLHACLDPKLSASLAPLDDEYQPEAIRKGSQVLTQLPLNTIALDSIQGLPAIDWLVLDDLNDASAILDNGTQALKDTLLLQVKIAFQPTHERQPNLAEIQHWASRNGFRFYRLHEPQHRSHLPKEVPEAQRQATELTSADALLLPSHARMEALSDNQRTRLAFLLHTVFGVKDVSYNLLPQADKHCHSYEFIALVPEHQNERAHHSNQLVTTKKKLDNVDIVDIKDAKNYSYRNPTGTIVIMPCIDIDLGLKTADILTRRAGTDIKIVIAYDSLRKGFIKTLNSIAKRCHVKYVVYLAQDCFPGRNWLALAYKELEQSNRGLLAFNDGKWSGKLASFGMVKKSWAHSIYDDEILSSFYHSHCADDEITLIARCNKELAYNPNITLIEIDYKKGMTGGGNLYDRNMFYSRAANFFGGKVEEKDLINIANEYNGLIKAIGERNSKERAPLVSIVIPSYKSDWFEDCLKSAISQDYSNFEIIICDDSEDNHIEKICEKYSGISNANIQYHRNLERLGERKNLPECIRKAKGEYIKPLYDDDILYPHAISSLVGAFQHSNKISLASAQRNVIDVKGRMIESPSIAYKNPFYSDVCINGESLVSLFAHGLVNFIGEPSSVMFKKETADILGNNLFLLGGEITRGRGDLSAWMNILKKGDLAFLNETISSFRISTSQGSQKFREKPNTEGISVFRKMIKELGWHTGSSYIKVAPLSENYDRKFEELDLTSFWRSGKKIQISESYKTDSSGNNKV